MLLAGDIGGTKGVLAIVDPASGPRQSLMQRILPSSDYSSLESMLSDFLGQTNVDVKSACLAVAGPVLEGEAHITNLPWAFSEGGLARALGLGSVRLLNDLESVACAVPLLQPSDLHTINPGVPREQAAIAVIAPGTGLGEAFLTWDGASYRAHPSEGGHAGFAPNGALQQDLHRYLSAIHGHVSNERVCSGLGIPNLYRFLRDTGRELEPDWFADVLAGASDPTPHIVNNALKAKDATPICRATLGLFVDIFAAEAGNLALRMMASAGVYLGGGIPPRILPALGTERFMAAFRSKGRLSHLVDDVPVHVILNPRAAILGAAARGLREWKAE